MHSRRILLLATTNRHKLDEYRALFSDLAYDLLSLNDIHLDLDVDETGTTFQENAELKACMYAQVSGHLALADDSGLAIDALKGAPGIYSARFAGKNTPYVERFQLLFDQLRAVPPMQRTAHFHCVISIAEPSGYCRSVEGTIDGLITDPPRGDHGFGYDPIFLVPEFGQTTAEILPEDKNRISHRGKAARLALTLLQNWPSSPITQR